MFKFFRQIRHGLLRENRFSRYLLYAVGEILLVVIGILIALQINSWNEEQKNKRLGAEYLKSLRSDIVQDTTYIQNEYPALNYLTEDWIQFKLKIENPKLTKESLIQLAQYEFNPGRFFPRPYNKNTLTTLLSTGHIRLIPEELVDDILTYYALMDEFRVNQITNESTYRSALTSFTEKYAFEAFEDVQDGPLIQELIWNDVDPKDLAPRLSRLIKVKGFILNSKKDEFESLLQKGTNLIEKLDLYLVY